MVELVLLRIAEVGRLRCVPEGIEDEDDLPVRDRRREVLDEPGERERMGAVEAEVCVLLGAGEQVQMRGQRLVPFRVLAPHDRIAENDDLIAFGGSFGEAAIEGVVVAEVVRNPGVGRRIERLALGPERAADHDRQTEDSHDEPFAQREPYAVRQRDSLVMLHRSPPPQN